MEYKIGIKSVSNLLKRHKVNIEKISEVFWDTKTHSVKVRFKDSKQVLSLKMAESEKK